MKLNKITYFYPEKPVLMMQESVAFLEMSDSPEWVCEPKYNGSRCEVHIFDGKVEFWDRHGKHLKYNSDSLHEDERGFMIHDLKKIFGHKGYFVLDGELRHNKVQGIQNKIVIYDIHVFENELLNKLTFKERRDILKKKFGKAYFNASIHYVSLIDQYETDFNQIYSDYVNGLLGNPDEYEGIVIKNLNGKLKLGRVNPIDSNWMFKVRKKTGRHRY